MELKLEIEFLALAKERIRKVQAYIDFDVILDELGITHAELDRMDVDIE